MRWLKIVSTTNMKICTVSPHNQFNSHIPSLDNLPKELNTSHYSDTCIPIFTEAQFLIAKSWKWLRCTSIGEQIKKMQCLYTMDCYFAIKKDKCE